MQFEIFNFDSIRSALNLKDKNAFVSYLQRIYPDLGFYEDNINKGISKLRFIEFMEIPVIASEKMFVSFDLDEDKYLSYEELEKGLLKLYFGTLEETARVIFDLFDFNKNKIIYLEDVKFLLAFLPLRRNELANSSRSDSTKFYSKNFDEVSEYAFQLEVVDELSSNLNKTFQGEKELDFDGFLKVIQQESEVFTQLLTYLYQNSPFDEVSVSAAIKINKACLYYSKNHNNKNVTFNEEEGKKIIDPKLPSKFLFSEENFTTPLNSENLFNSQSLADLKKPSKRISSFSKKDSTKNDIDCGSMYSEVFSEYGSECFAFGFDSDLQHMNIDLPREQETKELIEDVKKAITYESPIWVYETDEKNVKKLTLIWMALIGKDIYYYTNQCKEEVKEFHHLQGCFIKELERIHLGADETYYYSFSIIFPNKKINFYSTEKSSIKEWIKYLRQNLDYRNIFDHYEFFDDLGSGSFGKVKLGYNLKNKTKEAIKIVTKKKLKKSELDLIRAEIDIMQFCKHPNIAKYIDHFENSEFIFIIMEYIPHGTLKDLVKQKKLSETACKHIISKIACTLKYLHDFGIVHRDIKPGNIMLGKGIESLQQKGGSVYLNQLEIKIIDFGLSKILSPKEKTTERYGTLSFTAPEIFKKSAYNKSVDIWSLGIMTYYLFFRMYPFDSNAISEKQVIEKILMEKVSFPVEVFVNNKSKLKNFIDLCLEKNGKKRCNIDKIVDHDWLKLSS